MGQGLDLGPERREMMHPNQGQGGDALAARLGGQGFASGLQRQGRKAAQGVDPDHAGGRVLDAGLRLAVGLAAA